MQYKGIPQVKNLRILFFVIAFSLFGMFNGAFAQNTDQPLTVTMNTGWIEANTAVSSFSIGDHVPITGLMNRNAYVYLFAVRPNGAVSLNFPANFASYNPDSTDNVIWGGEGQSLVRFVQTGNEQGTWNYVMIASLEALSRAELSSLNTAAALANPRLSTEWFVAVAQQAQVGTSTTFTQTQKEASFLWPHFEYLSANNLIGR